MLRKEKQKADEFNSHPLCVEYNTLNVEDSVYLLYPAKCFTHSIPGKLGYTDQLVFA